MAVTAERADVEAKSGLAAATIAFVTWGVLPLYMRALRAVPPLEFVAYRVIFCLVFVGILLLSRGELSSLGNALRVTQTRNRLIATAALISINWLAFVWAVSQGRVIEASLGYFINPLMNVLLGVVLLRERLSRLQRAAILLAVLGVAWLALRAGGLPYVALALAISFSLYGYLRKVTPVEATIGLAAETALLTPVALAYVLFSSLGQSYSTRTAMEWTLLVFSGLVTAVPLALFSFAARRIPYSTVGVLQYLAPTLQLLLGVFAFGEPFDRARLLGYAMIWLALALYTYELVMLGRRRERLDEERE